MTSLEYAMGLDPNAANSAASGAPSVSRSGGSMRFSYQRSKTAGEVNMVVEWSGDLENWSPIPSGGGSGFAEQVVTDDGEIEVREMSVGLGSEKRAFFRLRVE